MSSGFFFRGELSCGTNGAIEAYADALAATTAGEGREGPRRSGRRQ